MCDPELICLKRDIAVSKGQTVECMTVRHFEEKDTPKVEVWVGSGLSDNLSGQVTIIDLSDSGVEVSRNEPKKKHTRVLKDSLNFNTLVN